MYGKLLDRFLANQRAGISYWPRKFDLPCNKEREWMQARLTGYYSLQVLKLELLCYRSPVCAMLALELAKAKSIYEAKRPIGAVAYLRSLSC